jgi:RNA polymerase-binding transcription factor DksA
MADEADIANDYNDLMVSRALGKMRQDVGVKAGPKVCDECEEAIPEPRRKLGFKLCVQCAEETERRNSLFANY